MNWDIFDVGDDISRVIQELEKNLQLLNNEAIVMGFIRLYFEASREDLNAKAKFINGLIEQVKKLDEEYDQTTEEKQQAILTGQRKELVTQINQLHVDYRINRYIYYKQVKSIDDHKPKIIEETRRILKDVEFNLNLVNFFRVFFVELVYALKVDDLVIVEKLSLILQKVILPQFTNMLAYQGVDPHSKEGRKKMMDLFPSMIELFNAFSENHLNPSSDHKDFDFLFALTMRQTPLKNLEVFLNFQKENYEGDFNKFLHVILLDYSDLFKTGHLTLVQNWMNENPNTWTSSIHWTDGNRKVNFIKLVYALHSSKIINNGKGSFDKVLSDFAQLVNLKLGKNPFSNLSSEKQKRNADYNPYQFFDELKQSYQEYIEKER